MNKKSAKHTTTDMRTASEVVKTVITRIASILNTMNTCYGSEDVHKVGKKQRMRKEIFTMETDHETAAFKKGRVAFFMTTPTGGSHPLPACPYRWWTMEYDEWIEGVLTEQRDYYDAISE